MKLLVLGAGTAGTMVANRLRRKLPRAEWEIRVVDEEPAHHYQPGYLFVPFGKYEPEDITKPKKELLAEGIELTLASVSRIDPAVSEVELADGTRLDYDYLVVATGTSPRPDMTPGMLGSLWRERVFDFYTLDGAAALADALAGFDSGRLVVHIAETPIKCPVAPLEFAFLAHSHFEKRGIRDRVDIVYVTPLDAAFTKPVAAQRLGSMLQDRNIELETDFYIEEVDNDRSLIRSYDEREIGFDLLVTVPVNMGADFVGLSGLGDELNYVKVDHRTMLSKDWDNVFAIGDAADLPTSKAGSVAHFAVDVFVENFVQHIAGEEMTHEFDGHANCFVESGDGKALLIDFNYDVQPLPGRYPLPILGPFSLLEETQLNHFGKMGFRWIYWNGLLPGHSLPVPTSMSMSGKKREEELQEVEV